MAPFSLSLLVFGCIFCAGFVGTRLHRILPERHQSSETKDTVKIAMALVATMTAMVLGLLVSSAKSGYDAEKGNVILTAARIVMLDRLLAHYGSEAEPVRVKLKEAVKAMVAGIWPSEENPAQLDPSASSGDALYDSIQNLNAQDEIHRGMKVQAIAAATELGQIRWLLFEQSSTSISTPLLVGVILWLAALFLSFGLFAPSNATAIGGLLISAIAVSSAIFLIMELDRPFDGIIHISSEPMQRAQAHLGR